MSDFSNTELLQILACPLDQTPLENKGEYLRCRNGHQFALEGGIPVFSEHPRRELVPHNMKACDRKRALPQIDPFVDDWIVNTNGNLYWNVRGKLPRYPIPKWPWVAGQGKTLLDIGCGWGRWTMASALSGFRSIGLDVHLDALAAARRVTNQMGIATDYVCSEANHLPFLPSSIDVVYSYSVLLGKGYGEASDPQDLPSAEARRALSVAIAQFRGPL